MFSCCRRVNAEGERNLICPTIYALNLFSYSPSSGHFRNYFYFFGSGEIPLGGKTLLAGIMFHSLPAKLQPNISSDSGVRRPSAPDSSSRRCGLCPTAARALRARIQGKYEGPHGGYRAPAERPLGRAPAGLERRVLRHAPTAPCGELRARTPQPLSGAGGAEGGARQLGKS